MRRVRLTCPLESPRWNHFTLHIAINIYISIYVDCEEETYIHIVDVVVASKRRVYVNKRELQVPLSATRSVASTMPRAVPRRGDRLVSG